MTMNGSRHIRFLIWLLPIVLLGFPACNSASSGTSTVALNIFAAASLTEAFNDIATQYQKTHSDVALKMNFAGSQTLEQQIANGATADIFASADLTNMNKAKTAGFVSSAHIFARNKLVIIVSTKASTTITSLNDLVKKGVKIDLEAPSVPAGKYTLQVLDKLAATSTYGSGYKRAFLKNVVSQEDNVKAVAQKVALGEVDAGVVYQTDVVASLVNNVKTLTIPDQYNVIAQYPIAVVKDSAHSALAQQVIDYMLSAQGQTIFLAHHFLRAEGDNGTNS